jgi:excisionase family DNA binding protein
LLQPNPKQNHSKDAYDLPEAAIYLGIGKSTLRKALSEKEIIGDRVGRKWRFTKAQLDRYIKRGKSDAEIDSEVENAILNSKRKRK